MIVSYTQRRKQTVVYSLFVSYKQRRKQTVVYSLFVSYTQRRKQTVVDSLFVSYTQRRKQTVVYTLLIHDCTTFTSRENVLNENTVRTEGIQIIQYFIMSSISLVRHCCFY